MTPKTRKGKAPGPDNGPRSSGEPVEPTEFKLERDLRALAPPRIDPRLTTFSPLERAAETLLYSVLRAEFWLSPKGLLREWLRRILQLAIAVLVPLLIFAPMISTLLEKFAGWSVQAVVIATNLSKIPIKLSSGVAVTTAGFLLLRWLFRR